MISVEVTGFNASAWACWRCGKSCRGPVKYTVNVRDCSGAQIAFGGVCEDCVSLSGGGVFGRDYYLSLAGAIIRKERVNWRLRLYLAYRVLTGRDPWLLHRRLTRRKRPDGA